MRWLRGSRTDARVRRGAPGRRRGARAVGQDSVPGRPLHAAEPLAGRPSGAGGRAACGWVARGRAGSCSQASPEHAPPAAAGAASSRIPPPASRLPPPASLAGLGGLRAALNDLPEPNPRGELRRNAEAAFSPSSFEILFYL